MIYSVVVPTFDTSAEGSKNQYFGHRRMKTTSPNSQNPKPKM